MKMSSVSAALRDALTDQELVARITASMRPVHVSKHRQFDRSGRRIPGKCNIADNSSIHKRMRWARRAA